MKQYLSWGRQFRFKHRVITIEAASQDFSFMAAESAPMLSFAYGHTYGDADLVYWKSRGGAYHRQPRQSR